MIVVVCSHVLRTPEMPCIEILNNPMNEWDSGKNYLCPPCEAGVYSLAPNELHLICEKHCDAMTIIESIDIRASAAKPSS